MRPKEVLFLFSPLNSHSNDSIWKSSDLSHPKYYPVIKVPFSFLLNCYFSCPPQYSTFTHKNGSIWVRERNHYHHPIHRQQSARKQFMPLVIPLPPILWSALSTQICKIMLLSVLLTTMGPMSRITRHFKLSARVVWTTDTLVNKDKNSSTFGESPLTV